MNPKDTVAHKIALALSGKGIPTNVIYHWVAMLREKDKSESSKTNQS